MYSADGISWTAVAAETNSWQSVTYGGDKFVAVSSDGTNRVMWSYTGTGVPATQLTFADDTGLAAIDSGDAVVQNSGGTPVTSAITNVTALSGAWTSQSLGDPLMTVPSAIAYGVDKFIVVADRSGNYPRWSADGINWTIIDSPADGLGVAACRGVAYGNNIWVIAGAGTPYRIWYSTDGGLTFAGAGTAGEGVNVQIQSNCIAYGGGKFVILSSSTGYFAYSSDGNNWTTGIGPNQEWTAIAYGNGRFVGVSASGTNRSMWSTNGSTWNEVSIVSGDDVAWSSIAYGDNKFVAVARSGNTFSRVAYSTDGTSWTFVSNPTIDEAGLKSITYGDGRFVAVSLDYKLSVYSSDGINWTSSTLPVDINWQAIAYGGNKFVAVANSGEPQIALSSTG
jgi:hypothetical protein